MFTKYPNPEAVIADIRRIAAKTGQHRIAEELLSDIREGNAEAVGFGYFGEKGTLVFADDGQTLHVHAVYSHDLGTDEAAAVAESIARQRGLGFVRCNTVRAGLAYKLTKRGWSATLVKRVSP